MKENPKFDLSLERARSLVDSVALEVEEIEISPSNELLKDKWSRARLNADLPIYSYTQTLLEAGVDETNIKDLLSLVKDLEIDVSDPHTSSSELSVIAGVLSEYLIGVDLSEHRRAMDKVKVIPAVIQDDVPQPPQPIVYTESDREQFQGLTELKEWQRGLILSNRNFLEISKQVLEQNNQSLEAVIKGYLGRFWKDNGIDEGNKATVFFRDHKTYAGDIDFYYWGPEPETCTLELSRCLMSLGYKVDHRSNILVEDLIKSGKVENGFLAAYLQMYFYMGRAIEFNGDSFNEHYGQDVSSVIDLESIWKTSHKSLVSAAEAVGGVYSQDLPEYPGLKDYPFRLLTVTLMGLAMKYDVPFTLNHKDLVDKLEQQIGEEEAGVLRNSFYYINQARNLYQLITERRWEMMTPEIKQEVNRALVIQSGNIIENTMVSLAETVKSISATHFGEPENGEVLDLNEARQQALPFIAQSYEKVADRYKQIARL